MDRIEVPGQTFTDDDLVKLKTIFDDIDEDNSGYITRDHIRTCAQIFGQNPTDSEMESAVNNVETTSPGLFNFDECRRVMEGISKSREVIVDDLNESLSKIIQSLESSEGDMFRKEELKAFLRECGDEPLLDDQIDSLFNDIDPEGHSHTCSKSQLIQLLTIEF